MNVQFWVCIFFAIVGVGAVISGHISWGKEKPHGVNDMLRGVFLVTLAIVLANGEMNWQLSNRVSALEAQLAKQPATENQAEQK